MLPAYRLDVANQCLHDITWLRMHLHLKLWFNKDICCASVMLLGKCDKKLSRNKLVRKCNDLLRAVMVFE